MRPHATPAMKSWSEAEASARAAEDDLKNAWLDYQAKRSLQIPESIIKAVADARSKANDLLTVVIHELRQPDRN
jgi:hypothetical protein